MNNFDKKVLFLDVDGTIVNPKNMTIPSSTIEILKELSTRDDIDVYISTGRSYDGLFEINEIKPYVTGYNLANGTQIIVDNKEIFIDPIDNKHLLPFLRVLEDRKLSYVLLNPNKIFKRYFDLEIQKTFDEVVKSEYEIIKDIDNEQYDNIIEAWVLAEHPDIDKLIIEFPTLKFYKWGTYGCDVVKQGSSKGTGIKKIVELLGYDINKTYAIGDADNDIPMFEVVKYGIAMGQANNNAKSKAKFITDDVDKDGLFKGIRKYVCNKIEQ